MSIGGFLRRKFYWTFDYFKGRPVGKHYNDISRILRNSNGEGPVLQQEHLARLLRHAVEHSPFYEACDPARLDSFPVINKSLIRAHQDAMKVPVQVIPEHTGEMHIQRTSGSTGTPLAVPQDKRKRNRRIAELKYFGAIAGYPSHEKMAQLRIWTKWQSKGAFQSFKENIYPVDCSRMNDEMLSALCVLVRKKRIRALWGYASWFDKLASFVASNRVRLPSLRVVIAGSEMLQPETRDTLRSELGCSVISRYSNEEQGVLGQDKEEDEHYHLNHASYFFEFLRMDRDEAAQPGELCRIVVTDLFNYAFPLIRYDTGDTGIYGNSVSGFPVLCKIYGRLLDLVSDTQGLPVHPMTIARILKNYDPVEQWQFTQKSPEEYELKWVLSGTLDSSDCVGELRKVFGQDAQVSVV